MADPFKLARDIVFGPNEPSGVETDGVKDGDVTFRFWFVNGPARSFTARVPKSVEKEVRDLPDPSARARLAPYLAEVMVSVANEKTARAQRAEREAAAKKAAELAPLGSSRNPLRYVVDPSMPVGSFALVVDEGEAVFAQWPSASVERVGPGAFEVTVPAAGRRPCCGAAFGHLSTCLATKPCCGAPVSMDGHANDCPIVNGGRLCPSCVSGVEPSAWLDAHDGRPCGKCGRAPTSGPPATSDACDCDNGWRRLGRERAACACPLGRTHVVLKTLERLGVGAPLLGGELAWFNVIARTLAVRSESIAKVYSLANNNALAEVEEALGLAPWPQKARDWRVPPPYDSCEVRHVKHAGAYACRYHNDDVPDQWRGFEGRGDTGPDAYADYCARIKRMHPDWRHGGTPRGVAPCEHLGDLMPGSRGAAYPICGRCGAVSDGPPNGFTTSRVGAPSAAYAAEVRACKACPKRMCSRHHPRDRADALAAHPEPQGADPYALYQVEVLAEALAPFGHDPTGAAVDEALSFAEQVRTTEAALHAEKGARLDALGKAIEVVKEGSKGR